MKIIFIHHSSFIIELEEHILVFDYFDKNQVSEVGFQGFLPELSLEKKILFFASHKHRDHFDLDNYRLLDRYPNVTFVVSKDAKASPNFLRKHGFDVERLKEHLCYVTDSKDYEIEDVKIHTLRSTDAGVAYYVQAEGKCFYHSGDLNDWSMEGAGDLINGKSRREYKRQVSYLKEKPIHAAFVVMDPRQKEFAFQGFDYFMKNTSCPYVFPMHMWRDYSNIQRWKERCDNAAFAERVMEITDENQVFEFEDGKVTSYVELCPPAEVGIRQEQY